MENIELCLQAYHAAKEALLNHRRSALGHEIQNKTMLPALSLFLDLENWPENPDLSRLTEDEKDLLREWGVPYQLQLTEFHVKSEVLRKAIHTALLDALQALGERAGREFLESSGALDQRIADVLTAADTTRKTMLDGIGYVDVLDESGRFGKGFYKTTKLKRANLFNELKLCAEYRNSGNRHSDEVMSSLGFVAEVNYENS